MFPAESYNFGLLHPLIGGGAGPVWNIVGKFALVLAPVRVRHHTISMPEETNVQLAQTEPLDAIRRCSNYAGVQRRGKRGWELQTARSFSTRGFTRTPAECDLRDL